MNHVWKGGVSRLEFAGGGGGGGEGEIEQVDGTLGQ